MRKYGGTNGLIVSAYVRLLRVRESDILMDGVVYAIRLQRGPGMVLSRRQCVIDDSVSSILNGNQPPKSC